MIFHGVNFDLGLMVRHLILHQVGLPAAVQSQVDVIMVSGFLLVVYDLNQASRRHIMLGLRLNLFLLGYQYHRVRYVPDGQAAMVA